jgi:histidinol-phosphate aminotransferase
MKYGRSLLAEVEGYVPGEQPKGGPFIKLNTNENPYPPSPKVFEALQLTAEELRKYPDPASTALRGACADRYGFDGPEWVIAGNGMDEILAMTIRTFVDPGDRIVSVYPTYTLYETLAKLHGAEFEAHDLDEHFQMSEACMGARGRLALIPRPNAPSGVCAPREQMEEFCKRFDGLVFIDEAYVDFADDDCMDLPRRFDNVIVGRTFSKSFSLAGMRAGLGFARPELIAEFLKTKDSYNLNQATQAAALAAVADYDHMLDNVKRVRKTRQRLTAALEERGFHVVPSQSNFVLAEPRTLPAAKVIFEQLREKGIFVRYFDARRLDNCLRITVGTDEEIDALLRALDELNGQHLPR